ncbi:hypothetical protein SLEP1_g19286 [Rubroshorea leprosula]|nr:hypothetical protein SLEP1_g19286 [Rubroshorea leprosula]
MYNFRKDDEGNPSFVLINKVTGQAMKHSVGSHQPVQLVHYSPVAVDESILWTESKDLGDGYKTIKKFTDSRLIVNASVGITIDGASIILQPWANGADNQQWKMESVRKPFVPTAPTVKLYCKAGPNLSVTIRDSKVVLAPSNPADEFQHWYKYDKSISKYNEDDEGSPFALVNKKTGQAIRHAAESHKSVQLIPYNPNVLNEFVLWTQGEDLGDGYKPIREATNTHLNFNACGGYVDDGTSIIVFPWANCLANELWRIEPYTTVKVYCKAQARCNITVVNGKVGYVESNPSDKFQHWYKDERYRTTKDAEGYPAFALINKATGHALKHSTGSNKPLQLVCYKPTAVDESILWTEGEDLGDGYKAIRMANNIHLNIHLNQKFVSKGEVTAVSTDPDDPVILSPWNNGADNEMWKMKTHSEYETPTISCSLL